MLEEVATTLETTDSYCATDLATVAEKGNTLQCNMGFVSTNSEKGPIAFPCGYDVSEEVVHEAVLNIVDNVVVQNCAAVRASVLTVVLDSKSGEVAEICASIVADWPLPSTTSVSSSLILCEAVVDVGRSPVQTPTLSVDVRLLGSSGKPPPSHLLVALPQFVENLVVPSSHPTEIIVKDGDNDAEIFYSSMQNEPAKDESLAINVAIGTCDFTAIVIAFQSTVSYSSAFSIRQLADFLLAFKDSW